MRTVVFVLACCAACAQSDRPSVSELQLQEMVTEKWLAYEAAHKAQDPARLVRFFVDDVWLRGPDPGWHSLQGTDSIEVLLAQSMPSITVHDIAFITQDLLSFGPQALESGLWSEDFSLVGSQEVQRVTGAYTVLWERQDDDDWKIKMMTWNVHAPSADTSSSGANP